MMTEVESKRSLKLGDLEVGKIFDDIELIISRHRDQMTTIFWEGGIEYGEEYDMRIFMYDLILDSQGNVVSVNNNGYSEVFPSDPEYFDYSRKLKQVGLFPSRL